MKKYRKAKKFLKELCKVPNISVVCEKVGVARNTVYRWRNEDTTFRKEMDKALSLGEETVSDLAHSKLFLAMQREEPWAIRYWLDNHHKNYVKPRSKSVLSDLLGERKNVEGFEVVIRLGLRSPTSNRDKKEGEGDIPTKAEKSDGSD